MWWVEQAADAITVFLATTISLAVLFGLLGFFLRRRK